MANRIGRAISVGLGFEDSYGAGQVAPALHIIGRSNLRMTPVRQLDPTPEVSYDPNPAEPIEGPHSLDGEFGQVASADATPFMVEAFTGSCPFLGSTSQQITCSGVQVDDTVTLTTSEGAVVFTAKAAEDVGAREFKCEDGGGWTDAETAASLRAVVNGHVKFSAPAPGAAVVVASSATSLPLQGGSSNAGRLAVASVAPHFWRGKLVNAAFKSLIAEKWDHRNGKGDLYKGLIVYGMRLSLAKRSAGPVVVISWRVRSIGAAPDRNRGDRFDATPIEYTDRRLGQQGASLTVDGSSDLAKLITQFDLDVSWEVHEQDGVTGNPFADDVDLGEVTIEATMRARRPAADTVFALCDDEPHAFVLTIPQPKNPTRYVQITLPEAKVAQIEAPDESDRGPVDESFRVAPYSKNNSLGTSLQFDIVNDRTTL